MSLSAPSAQYTGLSTDTKPTPTDAVVGTVYYELDTFVTYYWTGSKWKTWEQIYKEGRWVALASTTSGNGFFSGSMSSTGTFTRTFNATYGQHQQIATGTTIGDFAGIASFRYTDRSLNPYLRIVFALDTIVDVNMFVGFTSYVVPIERDLIDGSLTDFYPDNSTFGIIFRNGQTDFELYTNGVTIPATPPGTIVGPVAPADTQIHTVEFRGINSVPKFQYKIDNAVAWTDVTTDLPAETQDLGAVAWIETRAASAKTWRLIDIYSRHDNKG